VAHDSVDVGPMTACTHGVVAALGLRPVRWKAAVTGLRSDYRCQAAGCRHPREDPSMSVARVTEISARSDRSFEAAINEGIDRANKTLRNVKSAWIKEQQVDIENGAIVAYRVNMLITFVLDD
jgi:flavin-binding protein dodecin